MVYKYQSGIRANVLTDSFLAQQTDFVLSVMDKGIRTGVIFLIDLQKAFHSVDYKVLKKRTCIGFKISVIKWFMSYLSNRKFFISVDNIFFGGWNFKLVYLRGQFWGHSCF